ncbi:MAG: ABC transporter ATP-binding protein [Opitutales bacterium]|nr:ABC transporter ATP-binding protein [Opitutales bacterium]
MNEKNSIILKAEKLAKSFHSGSACVNVLHDASLCVRAGRSLSIRGESGCGKTTLLNLLSRIESADSGQLFWQGREVDKIRSSRLARERGRFMGMVFQAYYLVPELDSLGNVLLAARVAGIKPDRARAESLLERVGLKERMSASPLTLSGGERQRVAVARALMNKPQLMLADEPTGNLDEKSGSVVMDMLMAVCAEEGASLVLVTHNRAFAARTGEQFVMHDGHLFAE